MKQRTQLQNESSLPMKIYENIEEGYSVVTSGSACPVLMFEEFALAETQAPEKYTSISDLVARWEKDPKRKAELKKARHWVADTFHGDDGDTVRTMRLHKEWSQARLAQEIGTSQSHVARIERGTENLAIETCRKLCHTLDIDMNVLNLALLRQEKTAQKKTKN